MSPHPSRWWWRLAATAACALVSPRPFRAPPKRRSIVIAPALDLVTAAMNTANALRDGVDAAAPVVKSGLDAAAPVVKSAVAQTALSAGEGAAALERAALTPDQVAKIDRAGVVATQAADVAGWVGRGVWRAGRGVVDATAPYVEETARTAGPPLKRAATDVLTTGSLGDDAKGAVADALAASERGALRGVSGALRGAADALGGAAQPPPPAAAAARPTLPDQIAASLGRAAAPYAASFFVLGIALAALRELVAPVEAAARRALALGLLVLIVGYCVENWDTVYGAFQIGTGARPLFILPHF
jgi:hypothetical protein